MGKSSLCYTRMVIVWRLLFIILVLRTDKRSYVASSVISPSYPNSTDPIPNPRKDFRLCNRIKPSYICDPDAILNSGQVDKLDLFAKELRISTPCLCGKCSEKDGGVQIGVFIKQNLTLFNLTAPVENPLTALAIQVSETWKFGKCANDIIITVLAEKRQAGYYMGVTVQSLIPDKTASKIIADCAIHFGNENYYQGLESMINSFRDVLQRFQKIKPPTINKKNVMIIGIASAVGILILIVAAAVAIKCRQIRSRTASTKPKGKRDYSGLENINNKYMYSMYSPDPQHKEDGEGSSSDEGIDLDSEEGKRDDKQYKFLKLEPPRFLDSHGRQLSDVFEDAREDDEALAVKYAMNNTPRNCNINVTEL